MGLTGALPKGGWTLPDTLTDLNVAGNRIGGTFAFNFPPKLKSVVSTVSAQQGWLAAMPCALSEQLSGSLTETEPGSRPCL